MIARRSVWSDARVRELARSFVPAADEVHRLQTGSDAECRIFQRFCEEGHYGGRTRPTTTRQGIYACSPSGVFLASCNTRRPAEVADMLEKALARWRELDVAARVLTEAERRALRDVKRWEDRAPGDGLVLRITSRDLPGAATRGRWHRNAWNQDHAWFTREQAAAFVPDKLEPGAKRDVPARLVRRLAACHLIDNVRGQTPAYAAKDVRVARLTSRIESLDGDRIKLRLSGQTAAEHRAQASRGIETTILGSAVWDRREARFVAFELVAVGERWGRTRYNARGQGERREPIGFVLALAPADASCRVAPAAIWSYGWERSR